MISELRSHIMRSVKSRGNKSTELALIKYFKSHKIVGWRRNYRLFGNPDFVFPAKRVIIFADGCFWHGHNCRGLIPKTNKKYWQRKIKKNKARDVAITNALQLNGWTVMRVWECEISSLNKEKPEGNLRLRLIRSLQIC